MRTVKAPDVRKQEILDGAIRVFAEKGYDKATIASIAKELNISQGLCYRYFPSKEEIYYAAIEKYADLIAEEYLQRKHSASSLAERIDGIAQSIARLTAAERKDPALYALFHGSNSEMLHNTLLLKVASRILPSIQETLRSAKDRGKIHIADPDGTAILGLYGAIGVLLTEDLSDDARIQLIRAGWERLLQPL